MQIKWQWFLWQVIAPLTVPVAISAVMPVLWLALHPQFSINWHLVIGEVTPWALAFYCVTLIGASMNELYPRFGSHPVLGAFLIVVAIVVSAYAGMIVISRHDPAFVAGIPAYIVSCVLLVVTVYLCHKV